MGYFLILENNMIKLVASFLTVFCLGFSALFGAVNKEPVNMGPASEQDSFASHRTDKLDDTSQAAQMKLQKVETILSKLVPDPSSYHLVLSNNPSFGGEAVPPYVLSDKPTIIIYDGALAPNQSKNELVFMIAHELGHLNLYHGEKMNQLMDKFFSGNPVALSGITFNIYQQKFQERQADFFGLNLYEKSGNDLHFFQKKLNTIIKEEATSPKKELSTLSMKDSHFSMKERFQLLAHTVNPLLNQTA